MFPSKTQTIQLSVMTEEGCKILKISGLDYLRMKEVNYNNTMGLKHFSIF